MRWMVDTETRSGITEVTAEPTSLGIRTLANEVAVDPADRPFIERLQKLIADQEKKHSEIELMPGKLSERYKGQSFPLVDESTENVAQ